jgi:proteasome activator subunit 4
LSVNNLNKQTFTKVATVTRKKTTDDTLVQRHAAICGICAIVESSPYDVPEWMPSVVEKLASFVNDPVPIKDTVKRTLQDFWR